MPKVLQDVISSTMPFDSSGIEVRTVLTRCGSADDMSASTQFLCMLILVWIWQAAFLRPCRHFGLRLNEVKDGESKKCGLIVCSLMQWGKQCPEPTCTSLLTADCCRAASSAVVTTDGGRRAISCSLRGVAPGLWKLTW